jgi:hypothetical protein
MIEEDAKFDLVAHLRRQIAWSTETFGPGKRTAAVLDHIRKELGEVEEASGDLEEWVDVIILAMDGAWRAGYTPWLIASAIQAKQTINEKRTWPDWRTQPKGKAIEHDRSEEGERVVLQAAGPGVFDLARAAMNRVLDLVSAEDVSRLSGHEVIGKFGGAGNIEITLILRGR